ncbi:MAG: rod shape-determining protein MreD [Treponema sp.]|jgi:rod shape-determining protein MreD|nr:rod shape-determining protein MreD [Treponema sp.]
MIRSAIWTVLFCVIAGILQSTVFAKIAFLKVIPDLALCILVFSAYVNGTMTGQLSGFFSGLLLDFLSAAPMGMNCLVRTLTGALAGLFKGALFLDFFFMPMLLCALATLFKAIVILILHLIFGSTIPAYSFISSLFWIEMGLNSLCAPLLFFILRRFNPILTGRRE